MPEGLETRNIHYSLDRLTVILNDMLSFGTVTGWNLEWRRSYVVESIWRITACYYFFFFNILLRLHTSEARSKNWPRCSEWYTFDIFKHCVCMITFILKLALGIANLRIRRRQDAGDMNRVNRMLETLLSQRHVALLRGCVRLRHGGGRERITTHCEDRVNVVQARRQGFVTTALQRDLQNATGVRISMQTLRNSLRTGMRTRRPAICIPLTRNHIQARLQWARSWTSDERWMTGPPVLFTDESRFLWTTDRRALVWRSSELTFRTRMSC